AVLKYTNDSTWTQFADSAVHWTALTLLNPDAPLTLWDMSADGNWIAAAGPGSKVYLWNRNTGQKLQQDLHQQNSLRAIAFSPDQSGIVTAGLDNYINKYHFSAMGSEQLMTNGAPIVDMILTEDNRLIYCGTDGLLMSLQILPTRKLNVLSENFSGRVSKLATAKMIEKDGTEQTILIAGLKSGLLKLYKLNEDKIIFFRELFTHRGMITDIQVTENGKLIVVALDGKVSVWDINRINDPSYLPLILDDHKWALSATYIPDENAVLVGSKDGSIRHWLLDAEAYAQKLCTYLQTQETENTLYINGQEIEVDMENLCPKPTEPIK
ncbi:MAG: WD40 repeat domain-containing protein, partial [Phaeodactylibacter sp.]|nr:WD40 repeat domain-containing protein [Phaeodactylibacter sp.]